MRDGRRVNVRPKARKGGLMAGVRGDRERRTNQESELSREGQLGSKPKRKCSSGFRIQRHLAFMDRLIVSPEQ